MIAAHQAKHIRACRSMQTDLKRTFEIFLSLRFGKGKFEKWNVNELKWTVLLAKSYANLLNATCDDVLRVVYPCRFVSRVFVLLEEKKDWLDAQHSCWKSRKSVPKHVREIGKSQSQMMLR